MTKTLAGTLVLIASTALAGAQHYTVGLAGSRSPGDEGDPDGRGVAVIGLDGTSLHYFLWVSGISAPTAAHIHAGRAGQSGGVTVALAPLSFASAGDGALVAFGTVPVDAGTATVINADPAAYYVNVHNGEFSEGAVRGQLLGDAPPAGVHAANLRGDREVPNVGDPDGSGFAAVVANGGLLHYFLRVGGIAAPTAAHIHAGAAGTAGSVVLDFTPSFTGAVAVGSVSISAALLEAIDANPGGYYFNVHNAAYPGGALRGQLAPPSTVRTFPVAARNAGQGSSFFSSDLRILNLTDEDIPVLAEWYPRSTAARTAPAANVIVVVAARGQAVVDNAVGTLFGANDRGAIRLLSHSPFLAVLRVFNDQRAAGNGTFGQFEEGLSPFEALTSGALMLGSNRPKGDRQGFRTNVGYFNPNPFPVTATFYVRKPDGTLVNSPQPVTFAAWANDLGLYHQVIPGIPAASQTQQDFFITFTAQQPLYLFSSPVDNITDDGLHHPALAAPVAVPFTANEPPRGTIVSPTGDVTITAGGTVVFEGSASDPDGDAVTVVWDFGDNVSSGAISASHTYVAAGTYTASFRVTDEHGFADPDPPALTVTVNPATQAATLSQLQAQIFTPMCASCHPPNADLNLRAGSTYSSTVNEPSTERPSLVRIKPGDPDNSYLYQKVAGTPGISGSRMPQGGPYLSQPQLDLLRGWIIAGAQNN